MTQLTGERKSKIPHFSGLASALVRERAPRPGYASRSIAFVYDRFPPTSLRATHSACAAARVA